MFFIGIHLLVFPREAECLCRPCDERRRIRFQFAARRNVRGFNTQNFIYSMRTAAGKLLAEFTQEGNNIWLLVKSLFYAQMTAQQSAGWCQYKWKKTQIYSISDPKNDILSWNLGCADILLCVCKLLSPSTQSLIHTQSHIVFVLSTSRRWHKSSNVWTFDTFECHACLRLFRLEQTRA